MQLVRCGFERTLSITRQDFTSGLRNVLHEACHYLASTARISMEYWLDCCPFHPGAIMLPCQLRPWYVAGVLRPMVACLGSTARWLQIAASTAVALICMHNCQSQDAAMAAGTCALLEKGLMAPALKVRHHQPLGVLPCLTSLSF